MIKAELPGGKILSFPDGTSDEVIDATVRKYIGKEIAAPDDSNKEILAKLEQIQAALAVKEPETVVETTDSGEDVETIDDPVENDANEVKPDKNREAQHQLIMSTESLNMLVGSLLAEVIQVQERNETKLNEITRILRTPRTLVKDSEGNPIGSKLEE